MEGHTDSITSMVLDGNILISGSDDKTIRIWNLFNFTPSGIVGYHDEAIQDMIFIRESGLLLSVS
jgi:WD40 repeat protein